MKVSLKGPFTIVDQYDEILAERDRLRACVRAAVEMRYYVRKTRDRRLVGETGNDKAIEGFDEALARVTLPDESEPIADDTV